MDAETRTHAVLKYAKRLVVNFQRGVITEGELVSAVTTEIAEHQRSDLAELVQEMLPTSVAIELYLWTSKALEPDYRYRPFIFGKWPSEEYRLSYIERMQPELVMLAKRFRELKLQAEVALDTPDTG